jgi:hypothetical protein
MQNLDHHIKVQAARVAGSEDLQRSWTWRSVVARARALGLPLEEALAKQMKEEVENGRR